MLGIQIRHCRSGSLRPHDDIAAVDGRLLDELTTIVSAAAAAILAARAGSLEVRAKADLSPVTAADHAAEALILEGLARLLPGVGGPVAGDCGAWRRAAASCARSAGGCRARAQRHSK